MEMAHLKMLLKSHGVTQTQLAGILGRDKSAITNLLQGKRQLKAPEVLKIAQFLNISESEVLGVEPHNGLGESHRIPFSAAPSAKAQSSGQVVKEGEGYYLSGADEVNERMFAFEVKDDSLNLAGILAGDVVISELGKPVEAGDIVIVQHYEGGGARTLLRRYQPPFLMPHSTISTYDKLHEGREAVKIVAPVLRVMRWLK